MDFPSLCLVAYATRAIAAISKLAYAGCGSQKKKKKKRKMPWNFCNAIVPPTDPSLFLTGSRGPPKNKRAARELNPVTPVVFTADE